MHCMFMYNQHSNTALYLKYTTLTRCSFYITRVRAVSEKTQESGTTVEWPFPSSSSLGHAGPELYSNLTAQLYIYIYIFPSDV